MAKSTKKDALSEEGVEMRMQKKAETKMRSALKKIKPVTIDLFEVHRIMKAVKSLEAGSSKNGDESLSAEVGRILSVNDDDSIPYLVKLSILNASGRGGDPKDLKEDVEIADELLTQPEHFIQLRAFLLFVLNEAHSSETVSVGELKKCTTVQDVIDLIEGKI